MITVSTAILRNGSPVGDLFDALLEAAFLPFPERRRGGRPRLKEDELRHDYTKARERWPGEKLKPLCRLMCKYFPKYHSMNLDALRKRISNMLRGDQLFERLKARGLIRKAEEDDSTIGNAVLGLTTALRLHVMRIREGKN